MKCIILLLFVSLSYSWKPIFVGHRGGYTGVENTVESYRAGVDKYGYAGLECDVRVTKDNKYVISHDISIHGDKGEMVITEHTLEELKSNLITQTRGGVTYTGHICTVEEYLQVCKEKNAFPVIELKWTKGINSGDMSLFPGLVDLVKKYDLHLKAQWISFMDKALEHIKTNYPDFHLQFLLGSIKEKEFNWIEKWKINPSICNGGFTEKDVQKVKKLGCEVAVWTVNSINDYKKYGAWRVYMHTCDYLMAKDMPDLPDRDFYYDWTVVDEQNNQRGDVSYRKLREFMA